MKKIIWLLLFMTQFLFNSHAQDRAVFKSYYIPEYTHKQTVVQSSRTETTYKGSETFLQKLKDNGTDIKTVTNSLDRTETLLRTGKISADGNCFPVTIEFIRTENKDGKKAIPDGTLIFGRASLGQEARFDSVASLGLSNDSKDVLLKTINPILSQVIFPDRELKIGESFQSETPITIPIASSKFEMTIKSTYTLLRIENGMGTFGIVQEYTMKTTLTEYALNATGNGKGEIIFDIKNHCYSHYETTMDFAMTMQLDGFGLDINSQSEFVQDVVVLKSKSPSTFFVSCEHLKQKEMRDSTAIVKQNQLARLDSVVNGALNSLYDSTYIDSSGLYVHSVSPEIMAHLKDSGRIEDGNKEGLWMEYSIDTSVMNQKMEVVLGKGTMLGNQGASFTLDSGHYEKGKREGEWSHYISVSEKLPLYWSLTYECEYKNGQKNGKQIIFNGNDTAWVQSMVNGQEQGFGKKFDTHYTPSYLESTYLATERGLFVLESFYPSGRLKIKYSDTTINNQKLKFAKSFLESGKLERTGFYINDTTRHGTFTTYYENGEKLSDVEYKFGLADGNYIFYHDNGKIWSVLVFSGGKAKDIISNFDRNGNRKDKGTLKNGNGTVIHYDEDGKQTYVVIYQNGEIVEPK